MNKYDQTCAYNSQATNGVFDQKRMGKELAFLSLCTTILVEKTLHGHNNREAISCQVHALAQQYRNLLSATGRYQNFLNHQKNHLSTDLRVENQDLD